MKTLHQYLEAKGSKSLTALASEIGISKSRLSQLRLSRNWPPDLALKVEAATERKLDASKLSKVVADARSSKEHAA